MGNCSYKGFETCLDPIQVMTPSGQVVELNRPKLVSKVLEDYPGHSIFRKDHLLSPLDHRELLIGGQLYYLFPLASGKKEQTIEDKALSGVEPIRISSVAEVEPIRMSSGLESVRLSSVTEVEPVRMSTSAVALQLVTKNLSDGSGFEVLPPPRKGVWKVKLAINAKQLEEILSEEVNTEALIEQMRVAAASSSKVGPRRSKRYWGVNLKPIFCNVMNQTVVDDNSSPKSVSPLLQ